MRIRGKWVRRALLASMIGLYPAAALADVLVIRAVGPSAQQYPPGRRLPDNFVMTLRANDAVTVLKDRGTRVFRGPGRISLASAPVSRPGPRGRRISAGAVRGAAPGGAPSQATTIWQFDLGSPGRACFLANQPLVLTRAEAVRRLNLVLARPGGTSITVPWPAGQERLVLSPDQLQRTTGIEYRRANGLPPRVVSLMEIKEDPADRAALVLGLMKQGCSDQVETFVRINAEPAE